MAAVQATPVFLDRDATVEKVVELTAKAAAEGAGLVVFPEAFVPTYPDWVWRTPAWRDGVVLRGARAAGGHRARPRRPTGWARPPARRRRGSPSG